MGQECRELLSIQRHPGEACAQVRDLIAAQLAVVRARISDLQKLETDLSEALRQCGAALRKPPMQRDCCPVLQEISASRPHRKAPCG
ncbi:MAG TPA: MerR family DNA-binding protein [Bryobacteraceae bacterium]|nr:MerR family DNA-binding protein [Bryobacteraceae bacterium]